MDKLGFTLKMCANSVAQSCPILCHPMDCIIVHQVSLSVGFPRQEYWSGLPFLSPGDLPKRGIKPTHPALAGTEPLRQWTLITRQDVGYSLVSPGFSLFFLANQLKKLWGLASKFLPLEGPTLK